MNLNMKSDAGPKLGVGIIGLGVGEKHIEGFLRHPAVKVQMICDFDEKKLDAVSRRYPGVKAVKDANEILDSPYIDIVSIASYDNYHFEHASKALVNGKHVFVEKPLCLYEEEAVCLWKLLKERPSLKLSSNLVLRASPRFRKIREKVRSGDFGKITYIDGAYDYGRTHKLTKGWRGGIDFYSIVYGGAVHIIDLICWMTGERVDEVFAYGAKTVTRGTAFKYNDVVAAVMRFSSGALGRVTANFACVYPHYHEISVFGERCTFVNSFGDGALYSADGDGVKEDRVCEPYRESSKGDLIFNFVDSIVGVESNAVPSKDVFDVMSVCFAIEKSVVSGVSEPVLYFE